MEAGPSGEAGDRRPSALLRGRTLSHSSDMAQKVVEDHLAVHTLIRAYQVPHTHRAPGEGTPPHPHYLHIKILILYFKSFAASLFNVSMSCTSRNYSQPNMIVLKKIHKNTCQKSSLHSWVVFFLGIKRNKQFVCPCVSPAPI